MSSSPLPTIYLIGAQCSGKTTLLQALATELQTYPYPPQNPQRPTIIPEVVRAVMRINGFTATDVTGPRGAGLQMTTLRAQHEEEVIRHGHEWCLCDRSGLDPLVYAQAYSGGAEALVQMWEWGTLRERMRRGLVVLCEAGNAEWLSWDDVRVRYQNWEAWRGLHWEFVRMLEAQRIPFVLLSKDMTDLGERVRFVVDNLRMKMEMGDL